MIPKGTEIYCPGCGGLIGTFTKDMSRNELIRNAPDFIDGIDPQDKLIRKCDECGTKSSLSLLIVKKFDAIGKA